MGFPQLEQQKSWELLAEFALKTPKIFPQLCYPLRLICETAMEKGLLLNINRIG